MRRSHLSWQRLCKTRTMVVNRSHLILLSSRTCLDPLQYLRNGERGCFRKLQEGSRRGHWPMCAYIASAGRINLNGLRRRKAACDAQLIGSQSGRRWACSRAAPLTQKWGQRGRHGRLTEHAFRLAISQLRGTGIRSPEFGQQWNWVGSSDYPLRLRRAHDNEFLWIQTLLAEKNDRPGYVTWSPT